MQDHLEYRGANPRFAPHAATCLRVAPSRLPMISHLGSLCTSTFRARPDQSFDTCNDTRTRCPCRGTPNNDSHGVASPDAPPDDANGDGSVRDMDTSRSPDKPGSVLSVQYLKGAGGLAL